MSTELVRIYSTMLSFEKLFSLHFKTLFLCETWVYPILMEVWHHGKNCLKWEFKRPLLIIWSHLLIDKEQICSFKEELLFPPFKTFESVTVINNFGSPTYVKITKF